MEITALPPTAPQARTPTNPNADPRLRAAAAAFEAQFIGQMLQPMFETVEVDPLTGGGSGEEMFRGLLTEEIGRTVQRAGGLGLADHILEALVRAQGGAE